MPASATSLTSPVWLSSCSFSLAGLVYDFPHSSQVQMYRFGVEGVRPGVGGLLIESLEGDEGRNSLLDEAAAFSRDDIRSNLSIIGGWDSNNIVNRQLIVIKVLV